MGIEYVQFDEVNVLASEGAWAWPAALDGIFKPKGINLLMAQNVNEVLDCIGKRRIHTMIIDMDSEKSNGLALTRVIKSEYPWMPCILLKSIENNSLLVEALKLNVFSVIDKPVDMNLLKRQLNRLFKKVYKSDIFSG